jgi:hypothetical protein
MRPPEVHVLGPTAREALKQARAALPTGTTGFEGWPGQVHPGAVVLMDLREIRPGAPASFLEAALTSVDVLVVVPAGTCLDGDGVRNLIDEGRLPATAVLATALRLWARGELPPTGHPLGLRPQPAGRRQPPGAGSGWTPGIEELPGPWRVLDPTAPLAAEVEEALKRALWPWKQTSAGPKEAAARAWQTGRWPLAWMAESLNRHLDAVRRAYGTEAAESAMALMARYLAAADAPAPVLDEDMLPLDLADVADEAERHDRSLLLQLVRARDLAVAPLGQRLCEEGWRLRRQHLPGTESLWRLLEGAWNAPQGPAPVRVQDARVEDLPPPAHRRHGGTDGGRWFVPVLASRKPRNWSMPRSTVARAPTASPVGAHWPRPRPEQYRPELWRRTDMLREWRPDGWWLTWGEGEFLREWRLGLDGQEASSNLDRLALGHARSWWRRQR